jgi:hypothetical protein
MRLVSNKESVARGEVSILAIVETLLAIALVFYLSAHFNTLRWLAVAMCVAPLLLLRTDESVQLGIRWLDRWDGWLFDTIGTCATGRSIWSEVKICTLVFQPFIVRIGATIVGVLREPAAAIQAIPTNWARVTLATDTFFAPELVPEHPVRTFQSFMLWVRKGPSHTSTQLRWMLAPLTIAVVFLPALLYRWSLKVTSIIYAPLVFVAHSTFSESEDLRTKLELIKRGDLSRIRVFFGVVAIALFVVKLVLMMNLPGFADWWNGHPVSRFLALYVAPAEIPKWQLAEFANSLLAIGAMVFARHALLRYDLQHPWPEVPVRRLLGFVSGLRWLLALYAILCTGYITMRAAQHWHWPALGEKWLPW